MSKDYFGSNEFWSKPTMSAAFLDKVNLYRERLNQVMNLTSTNQPVASHTKGDHPTGHAVDFTTPALPLRVWSLALEMNFGGIGLYKTYDGRPYYHIADGGIDKGDRWIGHVQKNGTIKYLAATPENLKQYFA